MAVQASLYTHRIIAPAAPGLLLTIPPTHRGNYMVLTNEDSTNALWVKWGNDAAIQASVGQVGPGGSYRLGPEETRTLPGVSALYISIVAEAGTPYFKMVSYAATGVAVGIGGS